MIVKITEIKLEPLQLIHVAQWVADTLHTTVEKVMPLAELLHEKTDGNPFFLTQLLKSLYENDANDLLRNNQIKVYIDGIVSNTTAAMHSPYEIDFFEKDNNNGINYLTQNRLENFISALEPIGFDFHIHAIGNKGIHEALNAIENASSGKGRHRITQHPNLSTSRS